MARTIRTILLNLPYDTRGFCAVDEEGTQTIVLNARLTYESNINTYKHEVAHRDDFNNTKNVNKLEKIRHK